MKQQTIHLFSLHCTHHFGMGIIDGSPIGHFPKLRNPAIYGLCKEILSYLLYRELVSCLQLSIGHIFNSPTIITANELHKSLHQFADMDHKLLDRLVLNSQTGALSKYRNTSLKDRSILLHPTVFTLKGSKEEKIGTHFNFIFNVNNYFLFPFYRFVQENIL